MGIWELLTALVKIFIMILPGFFLKRRGILNQTHTEGLSAVITTFTYPCLVISAMQMEFSMEILQNCKYVILIFMGVILSALALSKIITKIIRLERSRAGILSFMLVFGNTGFVGLPVLNGLFGPEAVFYGALCDSSYDIFMFTLGLQLIIHASAENDGKKRPLKEILKGIFNPCLFGVLIGLTLYISGTTLPDVIGGPVETIGAMTSPLAMFVVGSQLAEIQFQSLFSNKYTYLVCLMKLVITPFIALGLVRFFLEPGSLLGSVVIMQSAMPVAMCAVIFSQQYKGDVEFATKGVLLSTVMCIVTIPMFAVLSSW